MHGILRGKVIGSNFCGHLFLGLYSRDLVKNNLKNNSILIRKQYQTEVLLEAFKILDKEDHRGTDVRISSMRRNLITIKIKH